MVVRPPSCATRRCSSVRPVRSFVFVVARRRFEWQIASLITLIFSTFLIVMVWYVRRVTRPRFKFPKGAVRESSADRLEPFARDDPTRPLRRRRRSIRRRSMAGGRGGDWGSGRAAREASHVRRAMPDGQLAFVVVLASLSLSLNARAHHAMSLLERVRRWRRCASRPSSASRASTPRLATRAAGRATARSAVAPRARRRRRPVRPRAAASASLARRAATRTPRPPRRRPVDTCWFYMPAPWVVARMHWGSR